jgi:eukaryotic-like serine/threonine-protein kinase
MVDSNPADCLEGRDLGNGWTVESKITRKPNSTGGCFSVGYEVRSADGRMAFLKALDFSEALRAADPAKALQSVTEQFNFERAILEKCRDRKLDRILIPITDGKITVNGFGPFGVVLYLIFARAEGDIRNVLVDFRSLDLLWSLTSLHHVSVGLQQLHNNGTAHQDLKPSNVLFMGGEGSKITDLGRASDKTMQSPFDGMSVPGDFGYAAPDLY